MLSIFLLAILVLIQIMLVSQIFNAIKIPKGVPHYHKRLVIRDLIELTFMSLVIYLLSLNYLEFMGLNIKSASCWSLLIIAVVIVGYLVTNYKTIMEGFKNNNISGYLAENYSLGRNPESIYRFNNLYPFSLDERGVSMPNNEMVNVTEAEFNNNSPQKKLHVTFVNEPAL